MDGEKKCYFCSQPGEHVCLAQCAYESKQTKTNPQATCGCKANHGTGSECPHSGPYCTCKSDPTAKAREIADWFLPPNPNVTEDPNSLLRAEIAAALSAADMEGFMRSNTYWVDESKRRCEAERKAGRDEEKKAWLEISPNKYSELEGYRRGLEEAAKRVLTADERMTRDYYAERIRQLGGTR